MGREAAQRGQTEGRVLQVAEAGVDRPEVLGLSVHDAGEASGEQLRAGQTNLELQALGVAQAGRRRALRDGGLRARGQERGAAQKLAVREQSGAMFGLGAHSLREEWRGGPAGQRVWEAPQEPRRRQERGPREEPLAPSW